MHPIAETVLYTVIDWNAIRSQIQVYDTVKTVQVIQVKCVCNTKKGFFRFFIHEQKKKNQERENMNI